MITNAVGGRWVFLSVNTLRTAPPPPPPRLRGENSLQGPLEGVGPKNQDFLGPEMATSENNVLYLFIYMALGLNDFDGGKSIYSGHWKEWALYENIKYAFSNILPCVLITAQLCTDPKLLASTLSLSFVRKGHPFAYHPSYKYIQTGCGWEGVGGVASCGRPGV
jgi:hypothetical protein